MNKALEFINDYLHKVMCDDGNITVDETNKDYVILEYTKYPELPSSKTTISRLAFIQIETPEIYDCEDMIKGNLKSLIAVYKMSLEYKQSKYYKYDIVKDKIKQIEEDFK
jgi:hypothetical protein